jgi:hypothetical protein
MTLHRILLTLAVMLPVIAGTALAQAPPADPKCNGTVLRGNEGFVGACARASLGQQLLIHNVDALTKVVASSFNIRPSSVEPAGLSDLSSGEAAARLAGGSSLLISPAADVVAVTPTPKWNAWIDGKYTWNNNSPENFDLDGPLWNGLAGFDYKLSDKFTLGIFGSYESSDLDGQGVDIESDGWGVGPYIGIILTDNIVFSANVLGSLVDTHQTGPFNFDSERIQAAAALNGYWYKGTWRFTPGLSVSWSKEWMEETSNAAPDQDVEVALLTPSTQIGNTLRLSETATVEPWAGIAFDWTFINKIDQSVTPSTDDPYVDLRVQAGFNFGLGSNAQLSLTGEIGGLIEDTIDTYAGEANLAIQF